MMFLQSPPNFYFIGNHPVLDFVNTKIRVDGHSVDLIEDFSDLLAWLHLSGLLERDEAVRLETQWRNSAFSQEAVETARSLRFNLLELIQRVKSEQQIAAEHLDLINHILKDQVITKTLMMKDDEFVVAEKVRMNEAASILIPIAEAALELFCNYSFHLVNKCSNPECVLYFYDTSKNSTRRWCSQKTCGNRMKVKAFLERQRNKTNA